MRDGDYHDLYHSFSGRLRWTLGPRLEDAAFLSEEALLVEVCREGFTLGSVESSPYSSPWLAFSIALRGMVQPVSFAADLTTTWFHRLRLERLYHPVYRELLPILYESMLRPSSKGPYLRKPSSRTFSSCEYINRNHPGSSADSTRPFATPTLFS